MHIENNDEKRILKFSELLSIISGENGEPLIDLSHYCPSIRSECHRKEYPPSLKKILVREAVAEKLKKIQQKLSTSMPDMQLLIAEGYRHPLFQDSLFTKEREKLHKTHPNLSAEELDEMTHLYIAHPSVAGHTTGGAIDLTLSKNGQAIDMGTGIADFNDHEKMLAFSQKVSAPQRKNRLFLRSLMLEQNFAPFNGEWWHFSYGDREWAAFYHINASLYSPIRLDFLN